MFRKYHVGTVPFTNRAHLVTRSQQAVRLDAELYFIDFKNKHATVILPKDHEISVRVNRILSRIVDAICPRLASMTQEPLDWAARLDWEAVVLRDDGIGAWCWADAGKILVHTGTLDHFTADEEIAVILAHEVGHVIARHSSDIIERLAIRKWFPTFLLLPLYRRFVFSSHGY
ncbi:mitochondrial metalloendopeptidase OMA1-like [Lolium perenne]|uniref:mitochondrial metalloendopeptidase OMA1-like n=1 Tax=Lolium perenne TaxID=4522 RepID=UPI0021F5AD67|nr:mitochondrial metalloendopeptidase OMA1-like [Lolium perenne]